MFTAVAALSVACPASVHAVPTTYQYTGNPFTDVIAPYTTSDFVTALVTLAAPLAPNMPLTDVTPTAYSLSDGVQTFTNLTTGFLGTRFKFQTNGAGEVTRWDVLVEAGEFTLIITTNIPILVSDFGSNGDTFSPPGGGVLLVSGENHGVPGPWTRESVPDAASTFTLLSLSLTALGVATRRLKRAAA
jgi:hypothetical protein